LGEIRDCNVNEFPGFAGFKTRPSKAGFAFLGLFFSRMGEQGRGKSDRASAQPAVISVIRRESCYLRGNSGRAGRLCLEPETYHRAKVTAI